MQRILTDEEITALENAGVNMNGVAVGDEALPEEIIELERLGVQPATAPVAAPVSAPVSAPAVTDDRSPGGNLAVEATPAAPAVTAAAPVASNANILQQLLAAPTAPAAPTDPYENLSKTQRRMLAFAGLSDAGAALQGGKGGNVSAMLGRFNEQADMQRKATAAQATRDMFAGLTGGAGGVSALPPNATPAEIDAHIAKLTSLLASPQGAMIQPYVTAEVARLTAMKEQSAKDKMTMVSAMQGVNAVDALLSAEDLTPLVGMRGSWNAFKNQFGAAQEYASLIMYVDQIKGLNFVDAFQDLKGAGPVTDTEGAKATAARSRIDAALKGNVADLTGALMDVRELFADALRQNPAFKGNVASAPTSTTISPEAQAIIDSLQPNSGGKP